MQLEIKGISKYFGNRQILQDINIHLEQGELVCILGTSGVGKTTLFHIIAGLYYPEQGNILLNRQDITGMPGQVSYMLQKDMMLPYKTVLDNVALPLMIRGEGTPWKRKKEPGKKPPLFLRNSA